MRHLFSLRPRRVYKPHPRAVASAAACLSDHRGNKVRRYKLTPGKLEGVDPRKDKRMDALLERFKEDVAAYGAGDQLVRGDVHMFFF